MKTFCMICGRGTEYIGAANKPSNCPHCGGSSGATSGAKESDTDSHPVAGFTSHANYVIEGINFERGFLLKLVSVEEENADQ